MLSKPLLATQETADLLKVSEATFRAWLRAGKVRASRFECEWRVAVKDLAAFLNARATRTPDAP